ncbi:5-methylcytosine-specific restriction enzyme subunit McrC [Streptomyces sp. 1222.5]|uniref:McrC family protein n=1 Tax=unclassified Streptomyces TaxID=2593676 RepID=UPI00089BCC64|nr:MULTISPECIES: restriction endonuclease [unclassified Streptomyces]PKW11129.1 5-methylcytosine-specific restriction enzyme subunit McrC [Streptomyces sp. 5112.2]SEB87338.1 5-methylcytosine-specific restriction enzyme subunit McrC [Streptomyces sp. 1222.5]
MTAVVELVEHAPAVSLALPDAVGRALAASAILDAAPDPYTTGRWSLRAGSKVGAVAVEVPGVDQPVTVRITPKTPITRLFFLLGYSLDPKGAWRDTEVEVTEYRDLLPALADTVERQVDRAVRQGLLQGYRVTEDSALVVRGRIREAEQIRRRFGATLPVEVTYDEYTADIAENRLLRAAVDRLLRLPGVPRDVRRRLLHQRGRLAEVTVVVRGQPLPEWRPTRLNSRYHTALRLARVVLENASAEHTHGGLRINGFMFDMNKLFEDFVTIALREALRGSGRTSRLQDAHHLDEAAAVRMRPDFVLYGTDGAPAAVVDAKYKTEKRGGFPETDLYQMLAYCTALGLREGHLVYAKGNESHAVHRVRHAGIHIHQHALDLDQQPAGLLADIAAVARQMAPDLRV